MPVYEWVFKWDHVNSTLCTGLLDISTIRTQNCTNGFSLNKQAALKDSNLPLLNQGNLTPEMLAALEMGIDLSQDANDYAEDLSISRQSPQDELTTAQDVSRNLSR